MKRQALADRLVSVFKRHPELAHEFYYMASEIVDDFEDFGPVLQADESGRYSERTVIRRLQRVRNELVRLLASRRKSRES